MLLCPACGVRVTPCYPDQRYHPLCDPDPPGWTAEQLAEWTARARARNSKRAASSADLWSSREV